MSQGAVPTLSFDLLGAMYNLPLVSSPLLSPSKCVADDIYMKFFRFSIVLNLSPDP